MDERLVRFIAALRTAGVRVSLAESADAFQAVSIMGIRDREVFKTSLRTALVKEARHLPVYEELFPLFFDVATPPPLPGMSDDLSPEEANMIAEALRNFKDKLRQMLQRLMEGDPLSQEELDRLSKMVGMENATDLRYRSWMAQRMQRALGFEEVRKALQELSEMLEEMGMDRQRVDQLRQMMQANQQALSEQIDQYAGQQIAENMAQQQPEHGSMQDLLNQPFGSLSDKDLDTLRKEVRRMANVLRTRIALRQKRAKSGQLDAKSTIRANLKHGSVPIDIKHHDRTLKPRVVAICDVSTSMRSCSEFMLSLLFALQDQISKTHAFAFIDHLEYITPDFSHNDSNTAVQQVLDRMPSGYYNTDLGYSLEMFAGQRLDLVDSRTTFIIVGDGRNNYNDPRLDIFRRLARRSRRTIWLNPEPATLWGTGDSDMLKYAPDCGVILQVGNLAQLAAAVDKLLS